MSVAAHRGAGPRHRDHGRRLRALRVRGHAGDGHRPADDPRVLALRHRRRLRQGAREHQEPAQSRVRRTPSWPTSRSTRPWCARSTPRSWRCSRSARSCTSASPRSAPARSRTWRWRCSSAWPPVPTPRSSSRPRCVVQLKSSEKEITEQDARAKARATRDVDRYADVPVFTEDMPVRGRAGCESRASTSRRRSTPRRSVTPRPAARGDRLRPGRADREGTRHRVAAPRAATSRAGSRAPSAASK